MRKYGHLLKKHAELWILSSKNVATNCQEEQRICKCSSVILLRFEVMSLHCRNIGIVFIDFAELWVADMCGIMGPKFKQKWHVLVQN